MATAPEGIDPADLTDEQLEALENGEEGSTSDEGTETEEEQDEQDATAPAAVTTADDAGTGKSEQQTTTEAEDPPKGKPAGIASKNGKHVLPFHVLQAERRRADEAQRRADQAERELADLKAGKKPDVDPALTEEEVAQMEEDFPDHGKKLRAVYEKSKSLEKQIGKTASEDQAKADDSNPIQDAIDQNPLLLDWQITDPEKFGRAQEFDEVLKKSPKWKDKPLSDRFAHVARMVADEYGIPVDDEPAPSTSQATTTRKDPKSVIANATRTRPNTLSDFKGGATPDIQDARIERLSPAAQVDRWAAMTDDEIDAALAKSGG